MSVQLECREAEFLDTLESTDLAPEQEEHWERHLSACTACRERLDRAVQAEDGLLHLARQLGDLTTASTNPRLVRIREHLHDDLKIPDRAAPTEAPAPPMPAILTDMPPKPPTREGIKGSLVRFWLMVSLGVTVLLAAGAVHKKWFAGGAVAQEFFQSFKGDPEQWQRWELVGPDASECVRFEPAGVRFTLPRGYPGSRPYTGLATEMKVIGDFEVTVHFEILSRPAGEKAWNQHARLNLDTVREKPGGITSLSRIFAKDGKQFFGAWYTLQDEVTGKDKSEWKGVPTQAMSGRLRVARKGAILSYYVSAEPQSDFTLIQEHPWSSEPLKQILLVGWTGSHEASLDVRVSDFRLRADALPNLSANVLLTAMGKGNGVVAVIFGLGIALPLCIGVWFWLRQRRGVKSQREA